MPASVEPGDRPGAWVVRLDGRDQSAVDLDDPTRLAFDYVRRTAQLLDGLADGPIRVLHVGGGGLTLPRWVAATRPGSRQVVLEPDAGLVALVRDRLPLPRRSGISIREQDGRRGLADVRDGWGHAVVVDAFADGVVPDDLITVEAWSEVTRVLGPGGRAVLNLVDRAPFDLTRSVLAGMRIGCGERVSIRVGVETATQRGRRDGNLLLVIGPGSLPDPGGTDYRWLDEGTTRSSLGGGIPRRD